MSNSPTHLQGVQDSSSSAGLPGLEKGASGMLGGKSDLPPSQGLELSLAISHLLSGSEVGGCRNGQR